MTARKSMAAIRDCLIRVSIGYSLCLAAVGNCSTYSTVSELRQRADDADITDLLHFNFPKTATAA